MVIGIGRFRCCFSQWPMPFRGGRLRSTKAAAALVAGLWPFHSPKNRVTWLSEENGLRFADPGTVVSTGEFRFADSLESSCSIEVWAQPGLAHASGTMLAFHTARNPLQLALRQSDTDLWRASSSATKKARSPVPTGSAKGTLKPPRGARSSSTKSVSCRRRFR
jgi:hypothetical protein